MTREDFYSEILEHQKLDNDLFNKYQNIVIDIFKVFHTICINNNIPYYVMYGSLIGACRDNGFIPWDCDFDICMDYQNVLKLHEVLKNQLPDGYYFVSDLTDDDFPYFQLRICKTGYDHRIHVDVFYLYGIENNKKGLKTAISAQKLFNIRKEIKTPISSSYKGALKVLRKLKKSYYILKAHGSIDKKMHKICKKKSFDTSNYVSIVIGDSHLILDRSYFGTPQLKNTSEADMYIPECPEKIMEILYSNWKEYLPFEERFEEYLYYLKFIREIESLNK